MSYSFRSSSSSSAPFSLFSSSSLASSSIFEAPDSVCFPSAVPLFLFSASFASSSPSLASSSSNLASFDMRAYSSSSKTYLTFYYACDGIICFSIPYRYRLPGSGAGIKLSVLFSLISETCLRTHSRLFLFLQPVQRPLSLLMSLGTVSLVLHCLQLTRTPFHQLVQHCCWILEKSDREVRGFWMPPCPLRRRFVDDLVIFLLFKGTEVGSPTEIPTRQLGRKTSHVAGLGFLPRRQCNPATSITKSSMAI
ncbi:hypothetical protein KC349_g25 [Hortaea werneckii]|nr:hypothetical protein KC349_g25 [Hortaea werneckii]